jgi:ribosomal protein S27AE
MSTETTSVTQTAGAEVRTERARFCSRCGMASEDRGPSAPEPGLERVCDKCGMGVLLTCAREALPDREDAFLVVTDHLTISAVSDAAEGVFGSEESLVGSSLLSSMSSPLGDDALTLLVAEAARGSREIHTVPLYAAGPRARRFRRLEGRIATCSSPRAALVVVAGRHNGR